MRKLRKEPVHNQGRQATDTAGQTAAASAVQTSTNTDFRPHSNLKPNYLEKSSSHLEVKTFCEQVQAYIRTGYRSAPPQGPQGVWFHKRGNMLHSDFWAYLKEQIPLIEFDKLTAVGLAAQIFLQEGDPVMRKMTST